MKTNEQIQKQNNILWTQWHVYFSVNHNAQIEYRLHHFLLYSFYLSLLSSQLKWSILWKKDQSWKLSSNAYDN